MMGWMCSQTSPARRPVEADERGERARRDARVMSADGERAGGRTGGRGVEREPLVAGGRP